MEMCKTLLGFAHFHRHGRHELKTTKPDTSLATKTGHFHLLPTAPEFWTTADLEEKLKVFQHYYNRYRTHSGLEGQLPEPGEESATLHFASYRWQQHCRGLYQTPIAA